MGDFALILVTLPSIQLLGNTLIYQDQYLLQLQRMGVGNCQLMNGGKATGERPSPPQASLTSEPACPRCYVSRRSCPSPQLSYGLRN